MLIIARKAGESIWIGEDIEIKIMDMTGTRVRIGLEAPRRLTIQRGEVREAAEHNRAAAAVDPERAGRLANQFRFFSYTRATRR